MKPSSHSDWSDSLAPTDASGQLIDEERMGASDRTVNAASRARPPVALGRLLVPLLLAAALYAPSLNNGFSLDDFNWLDRATTANDAGKLSFVLAPEPGQVFNPVPKALLLMWVAWFGTSPFPFHLAILCLHLTNVVLVGTLGRRLSGDRAGFIAALLFAVLPAFHESIFWVAAFFHPLVTTLYLSALIAFLRAERGGTLVRGIFVLVLLCALLTKALAFALVPSILLYAFLRRGTGTNSRGLLVALTVACASLVAALNVFLGLGESYLLERGIYAVGVHWLQNLWSYMAWLGFPFSELFARLGLSSGQGLLSATGGLLLLSLIGLALAQADWRPKWWAGQVLCCLAPVLPFTLAPTSRYLYLAAAPCMLLFGSLVDQWLSQRTIASRNTSRGRPKRLAFAIVLAGGVVAASWAELRLVDNRYEYREQQMSRWVDDIAELFPAGGPAGLTIVGLPTLALDPGIHLEAALRVHWARPGFELEVRDEPLAVDPVANSVSPGLSPTLRFDHGSFILYETN